MGERPGTVMKRRGILAAAGAVVAGIAAKQAAMPVGATNGDSLRLGERFTANNTATQTTGLYFAGPQTLADPHGLVVADTANPADIQAFPSSIVGVTKNGATLSAGVSGLNLIPSGGSGVVGDDRSTTTNANYAVGVRGYSVKGIAVSGSSGGPISVYGFAAFPTGAHAAVAGSADAGGIGVNGLVRSGTGTGVFGQVPSGTGIYGYSDTGTGVAGGTTTGPYGVAGVSAAPTNAVGVYGLSLTGYGVVGITGAGAPYSGITGGASKSGAAAVAGSGTNGAYAAYFTGPVVVDGEFTVLDPARKHGAIRHPDGTHRTLYSMESPESWLEDFGKGTLSGGRAEVKLDADFAAVIEADDYYVFTVSNDAACGGLAVVTQRPDGFTVQEQGGGVSNGPFRYRVVARPKSERKAQRLAKFALPQTRIPTAQDLPAPPEPPKPPAMPAMPPSPTATLRPVPAPAPRGGGQPAAAPLPPPNVPVAPPTPQPAPPPRT